MSILAHGRFLQQANVRKIDIYMDFHVARAILDEFIHLVHKTGYVHFLYLKT